jgi:putative peptide zinc metalloprotease protein
MTSRRARVVTAISGPLLHLVLGSVWFIVAAHSPHGFLQAFAAASGLIQWQSFAVSLYPFCFLEMDGYHVFIDVLEMPRLKQDALAYVGKIFRGIVPRPLSRKEGFWIGYVALSVVSVAAFVAFNVWVVVHSS